MTANVDSLPSLPFPRPAPLEPPAELAWLRAEAPVSRVRSITGEPAWLVTRYEDARQVMSDRRFGLALPGAPGGVNDSLFQDPPGHTRLRRLVTAAFTPRRVTDLRSRTTEIANTLVASMAAGERSVDLLEAFAFPLPITVISELLGIPEAERESFQAWSNALVLGASQGASADPGTGWQNLAQQVSGLIASKRQQPGDDLLSALIAVPDTDGQLSEAELVMMAITLVMAGYATTAVATGLGTILLTSHDEFARLAAEPALIPTAVDEVFRFQGASMDLARVALEDLELAGVQIRAGDNVVVSITSANRDERRFASPDRFDITRADNPHLTFGHGIHHCLGAALARMELQVVFTILATQLPELRLAIQTDELEWQRSEFFGDEWPKTVPVSW
ncbi:MAG TPA: cytochrome P450 [Streptosporangiaceae bacterium]|nr:cytochrome P450 [Streptosporangiaceae bacterium]